MIIFNQTIIYQILINDFETSLYQSSLYYIHQDDRHMLDLPLNSQIPLKNADNPNILQHCSFFLLLRLSKQLL